MNTIGKIELLGYDANKLWALTIVHLENYIQYPVINHNGKEYEKECIYIHTHIYIYKMKLLYCIVVINKIL